MTEIVRLFDPINIGQMHVKNRIVFPALGTRFASAIGEATQRDVDHYRARAAGGAGLLVVPWVLVDTRLGKKIGRLRLDSDEYIRGLHEVVDVVHRNDAFRFSSSWPKDSCIAVSRVVEKRKRGSGKILEVIGTYNHYSVEFGCS